MFLTTRRYLAIASTAATLAVDDLHALQVQGDFSSTLREFAVPYRALEPVRAANVLTIGGKRCIALGNGAFATPRHVGVPDSARDVYQVRTRDGLPCDLLLFRLDEPPVAPILPIARDFARLGNQTVVLATPKKCGFSAVIEPPMVMNEKIATALRGCFLLSSSGAVTEGAATVERGDSGGGVLIYDGYSESWAVAGVLVARVGASLRPGDKEQVPIGIAIDLTLERGVGQQLIDYRDGRIRGGEDSSRRLRAGIALTGLGILGVGIGASRFLLRDRVRMERHVERADS